MENLFVKKLSEAATLPTRNHFTDAGVDVYSLEEVFLPVNSTTVVHTGVAIQVPEGFVGQLSDRSSMAKRGLKVGGGVIDAGYSGEMTVILNNLTNTDSSNFKGRGYLIRKGDRIAQLLLIPVVTPLVREVKELWESQRGNQGFGSSGR